MTQLDEILDWRGQSAYGRDGDKVGRIEEIYLDEATSAPEFAVVEVGTLRNKRFVPLAGARREGDDVHLAYNAQQIENAPDVDPDGPLSQREEAELYGHYGLEYSEARSESGLPGGEARDEAMTRSEEELRVGTTEREAGRVRLRKYVTSEQVQQTVPVQREEVRVEREPITDENVNEATSGAEIREAEQEVVLHEEEPVVEKRVEPKERVRLDTETKTERRQVGDTVRREEIDVDEDADRR